VDAAYLPCCERLAFPVRRDIPQRVVQVEVLIVIQLEIDNPFVPKGPDEMTSLGNSAQSSDIPE
jgi:hypothetical protein